MKNLIQMLTFCAISMLGSHVFAHPGHLDGHQAFDGALLEFIAIVTLTVIFIGQYLYRRISRHFHQRMSPFK